MLPSLAILNGASLIGRTFPSYVADRIGGQRLGAIMIMVVSYQDTVTLIRYSHLTRFR